jgi:hypothetical protein
MSNLNDFKNKNTVFTGTSGVRVSENGTTANRVNETARLRFNADTNLMEYYDGTQWKPIDSPPVIASISPATFASDGSTLSTITVTGSNFSISCTAKFIGNDGTEYTPGTVTRVSSSTVTMTTTTAMTIANEPYDVQVTNTSGLSATLENALDAGSTPAFTAAAGSLGTLLNGNRAATALTSQTFGPATDADGQQINYTITSGSLPPGFSLGTANDGQNGKIVGTATAVVTNTTSSFTIQASDGVNTSSRAYSITVNAPVVQSFTSGSGTFSVPEGTTAVDVLVVAGGGGGGARSGGGGGAGGLIYRPALPVTPGGSIPYSVGGGGSPGIEGGQQYGSTGTDSTFGPLTAKGGGGANDSNGSTQPGAGGSGGGQGYNYGPPASPATQPSQPGDSGTYGFGFPGGFGVVDDTPRSGGGGGSGGAGGPTAPQQRRGGFGGAARTYTISGSPVTYAGGGSGGAHPGPSPGEPQPNVSGGGGIGQGGSDVSGQPATANRGGGGGGSGTDGGPGGNGGAGGSGIIIVQY